MFGDLRVNFDVAFKDGNTVTSCILRNSGVLSWVLWVGHFRSENPCCAKAEAAVQAFHHALELSLDDVIF